MSKKLSYKFEIDWILKNKLAISSAPKYTSHLSTLNEKKIKSILNLCTKEEFSYPSDFERNFKIINIALPDHKSDKKLKLEEIYNVLQNLNYLITLGPTLVHCFAGIERSPLICIAWLIKNKKISPQNAFEYVKEVHSSSNPLPDQLSLLFKKEFMEFSLSQ